MLFYNMDAYDELKRAFYNLGRYLSKVGLLNWVRVRIERIKNLR